MNFMSFFLLYCQCEGIVRVSCNSTISSWHFVAVNWGTGIGNSTVDTKLTWVSSELSYIMSSSPRTDSWKKGMNWFRNYGAVGGSDGHATKGLSQRPALHEKTRTDSVFIVNKK